MAKKRHNRYITSLKKQFDDEWDMEPRKGGHVKWVHRRTGAFVFGSQTPSDFRAERKLKCDMRNAIRIADENNIDGKSSTPVL